MAMMSNKCIQFFFGLRSPYAWLAQRLIEDHIPLADQERIDWIPYWDPDPDTLAALRAAGGSILYRPMSRERHIYILGDLKRSAQRLGYPLHWPVDVSTVRWEPPHLACLAAAEQGKAGTLRRRLFAARWEEGRDICDSGVLAGLLAETGVTLPIDEAAAAALRGEAVASLRLAHDKGVFGLPYFCVGRERFWGVDRLGFALTEAGIACATLVNAWQGQHHAAGASP